MRQSSPSPSSPSPPSSAMAASDEDPDTDPDTDPARISARVVDMLARLHVLVVGPGLGRDPLMQETVARVLAAARERRLPVVVDADALALVARAPELVMGWREAVLTPNVAEFGRLWRGVFGDDGKKGVVEEGEGEGEGGPGARVEALSRALGGVTIVQKGATDYISDGGGGNTLAVDVPGGLKRSGGQGDTLTGSIATLLAWRKAYLDGLWDHGGGLRHEELLGLAAFGGAAITRVSLSRPPSPLPPPSWLTNPPCCRKAPASPSRSTGVLCRPAT